MVQRVIATDAAIKLIEELEAQHGPIMFIQSVGCCDGTALMCYKSGEVYIGSRDIQLGVVGNAPYYMNKSQFEYFEHTQIILDVIKGMGASFLLKVRGIMLFIYVLEYLQMKNENN